MAMNPKLYALGLHDRDVDEKGQPVRTHAQAMITFDNARSVTSVAKQLGDKPQYVEAWTGDRRNGYAYLCHRTANARGKFQYDPASIVANFDYVAELATYEAGAAAARTTARIGTLLDALYEGEITHEELLAQVSGSQIGLHDRKISAVVARRHEREAKEWRTRMRAEGRVSETIWLYGESGSGKTSMAKDLARKRADERGYFMSGSTRGVFDNYNGQHVLVLDEIGPKMIPYEDLKRITDPNAMEDELHAPARFHDKTLMAELIIFTSPYDPFEMYRAQVGGGIDAFAQFERRLGLVLKLDRQNVRSMTFNGARRRYEPLPGAVRPNAHSTSGRSTAGSPMSSATKDPATRFAEFCDSLDLP